MLKSISCHDRLYVDSPQKQQIQDICLSAGHIVSQQHNYELMMTCFYFDLFQFVPLAPP